jgi:hypothetical protein
LVRPCASPGGAARWIGPSGHAITDATVKAGGGDDAANLAIDTLIDQMPAGTVTVACQDIVSPGAHQAASAARARPASGGAQGAAVASPGVVSGNVVQVPIEVPVNVCGNTINVVGLLNPAAVQRLRERVTLPRGASAAVCVAGAPAANAGPADRPLALFPPIC